MAVKRIAEYAKVNDTDASLEVYAQQVKEDEIDDILDYLREMKFDIDYATADYVRAKKIGPTGKIWEIISAMKKAGWGWG